MEIITNSIHDWDLLFKKELFSSFITTKEIIKNKLPQSETIQLLSNIADKFYEVFRNSPIPVYQTSKTLYASEIFTSTSIDLPFSCFMVPYFFYEAFKENIKFSLEREFAQSLPWMELIGIIDQKWLLERKKLTKTDVLICKTLSRYTSKNQSFIFPITTKMIANRTRQSLSIIEKTFYTINHRLIANDFFLINSWKIGWEIYLLYYSYVYDDNFNEFDSITISKEILFDDYAFRIIQIPFLKYNDNLATIEKIIKSIGGKMRLIDSTSFHWDLSQLETHQEKSFSNIPDFFTLPELKIEPNVTFKYGKNSLNWISEQTIKSSTQRGKKIFDNLFEDQLISKKIIKILNFLVQYGIILNSFQKTAEELNISEQDLSKLIQYLIKNEVISLAYRFKFIGAGREFAFLIEGGSRDDYSNISQSLLRCPFSYFYFTNDILAGRIQIPDNWLNKAIEYFTILKLRNNNLTIRFGLRILGYNYFNPNVKLSKDYILNEFGSYNKHTPQ
jgi:hypothetical protein